MSNSTIFFCSQQDADCDKKQAFRFMGCPVETENEELERLYQESLEEVKKEAFCKAVWRRTEIKIMDNDTVQFDFGEIKSAALCKNLQNCSSAYVFAATVGAGIDRLLIRYKGSDSAKATVISAVASSAVECWCDLINRKIAEGKKTKPRFSPGYGGVELKHQKEILSFLDAERRLGITLSDSFFMMPVKSVTAFVGIEEE